MFVSIEMYQTLETVFHWLSKHLEFIKVLCCTLYFLLSSVWIFWMKRCLSCLIHEKPVSSYFQIFRRVLKMMGIFSIETKNGDIMEAFVISSVLTWKRWLPLCNCQLLLFARVSIILVLKLGTSCRYKLVFIRHFLRDKIVRICCFDETSLNL